MSIQRYVSKGGRVRYRARIKSNGRAVASKVFDRKSDAVAWEQDQYLRLRVGSWIDPRRGRVALDDVAQEWLASRSAVKRRTLESDRGVYRLYIRPRWGSRPVTSITAGDVSVWLGELIDRGLARSTVTRALATLRLLMGFAVADARVGVNVAAQVKAPTGGHARREGQMLTVDELRRLAAACRGRYAELVLVLGLQGLRWGELAGLRVGDLVSVPGPGLRVQRAVLGSNGGGQLFVDSVKSHRSRTVPLVPGVVTIVERWSSGKSSDEWLFNAPAGGPMSEPNWKRSIGWTAALTAIDRSGLRVHDLRHTAASVWLGSGADPKVVQRVLGHASAAMTMDLYGHLIDQNLWDAAARLGDTWGTFVDQDQPGAAPGDTEVGAG